MYLPFALQEVREKLAIQKELKTSAEKNVEVLSKKFKKIVQIIFTCTQSLHKIIYIETKNIFIGYRLKIRARTPKLIQ